MFWSSRKAFRIYYYMSSLLPVYLLVLIFMTSIKFNISEIDSVRNLLAKLGNITSYKVVLYTFMVLLFISFFCLYKVVKIINNTKKYSKTFGKTRVVLKDEYNVGFREFILSVILPMMSTFSIDEYPIPTLIMIIIFQLLIYIFFINSSDFFPNISLVALGYSIFIVESTEEDSNLRFVFGRTKNIDDIIKCSKEFEVIEIGESDYSNNIGVIDE